MDLVTITVVVLLFPRQLLNNYRGDSDFFQQMVMIMVMMRRKSRKVMVVVMVMIMAPC